MDELNVRIRPSTSARRTGTVRAGDVIAVWPVPPFESDGYLWYTGIVPIGGELPPLPDDPFDFQDVVVQGWFAAMKGSTAYVERLRPRCPEVVDLRNVGGMAPAEHLACFGNHSIEFEGTYGCPPCSPIPYGDFKPRWLADPAVYNLVSEVGGRLQESSLTVRFPPDGPGPPADGSIIRVRGHFDDPAAGDCSILWPDPWVAFMESDPREFDPVPAAVARHWCRQMFVVEGYDVIGTDPSLPGPQ